MNTKSTAYRRRQYVKALEDRIAQLEMAMSRDSPSECRLDHWETEHKPEIGKRRTLPQNFNQPLSKDLLGETTKFSQHRPEVPGDMLAWAMRDLSLQANGGFVGASAYLALGRVVGGIVSAIEANPAESCEPKQHSKNLNCLLTSTLPGQISNNNTWISEFNITNLTQDLADRLLQAYLNYIPSRWPILHKSHIMDLHSRRGRLVNVYETFTLTFVYAIGGRYTNPIRDDGESFPVEFFDAALKRLDIIIGLNDIRSVVCLLLLCIFSLKGPSGPSVW
jgi:hypothetical protein